MQNVFSADLEVPLLAGHIGFSQGDEEGLGILPTHPFFSFQGSLRASCVWVQVILKQV